MAMDKIERAVCKRLRTKGMFIDAEPEPSVPNMSDGFCWCTHTMNCLGPDGKVATKEICRNGRGCFESR
jgi:hypothetical protein